MITSAGGIRHDVVLVGGGHANIQVLRAWAMRPEPGVRPTVVLDHPVAVYSGMVPGFVGGQYRREDLEIDVRPLALRAGARCINAAAVGLDPKEHAILLDNRPPLRYDTAVFDVGSTVAGLDTPGVREHALPTRPIGRFVGKVDALIARARERGRCRLVIVGAGAGGVELAFTFRARLEREGVREASVLLLEAGPRVLPGYPAGVARRVEANARRRGIEIRLGAPVVSVSASEVRLAGGEALRCDAVVWVAGAASLDLFKDAGVATDERGFVRVRRTLQLLEHEDVFAVGDCASLEGAPDLAKAGVYAVREGPVLVANLRARLMGHPLETYHPQRDFLSLLNLGDGRAIGSKWGMSFEGEWVFRLKDWIDRRFVRRFQVLADDGALAPEFARMPAMGNPDMVCGGCAAKVGESTLTRALERLGAASDPSVVLGLGVPDDVAAVATERGEILVSSVDGFRAFTDDPYLVGRVAAVNAASDLWAKGVTPRWALASVEVPEPDPARAEEQLFQVLAGARATLDPEGVTLVGGHTTSGADLHVGFAIFGTAASADALLRKGGVSPGERLILTKPLGTGVLFYADMRGWARGEWMLAAEASMIRTNSAAGRVARELRATACTDISGFGLAGHLGEVLRASKCAAIVDLEALPLLPGAAELLARGHRSTFHPENAKARRGLRVTEAALRHPALDILFDPQTSGGLLFAVPAERVEAALAALHAAGDRQAAVIGEVTAPRGDGALFEVASGRR
jgi:selenide, water dikinase